MQDAIKSSNTVKTVMYRLSHFLACGAAVMGIAMSTAQAQAPKVIASGAGVQVTEADVLAVVETIPAASRPAVLARKDAIEQQARDLYLRRALAAQAEKDGLDKDPVFINTLRLMRDRLLSEARLAQIDKATSPKDDALDKFAEQTYKSDAKRFQAPAQTRASHILVRGDSADSKAKAEALLAKLKAGADFATLARENSADLATASKGGDLGYFGAGAMVKSFEDAVAKLAKPGDISDLVQTQFGYHIVRLEARRPAGVRPYDEVREEIKSEIRAKFRQDARTAEVNKIVEQFKPDNAAIEAFSARYR